MSELADRLVTVGVKGLHTVDCFEDDHSDCRELAVPVVVAVLREIGTWGAMQKYPVNLFKTLAEQIESGAISKALEGS